MANPKICPRLKTRLWNHKLAKVAFIALIGFWWWQVRRETKLVFGDPLMVFMHPDDAMFDSRSNVELTLKFMVETLAYEWLQYGIIPLILLALLAKCAEDLLACSTAFKAVIIAYVAVAAAAIAAIAGLNFELDPLERIIYIQAMAKWASPGLILILVYLWEAALRVFDRDRNTEIA